MLDDAECAALADLLAIFANRTRLRMFCSLSEGPQTVSQLAGDAGVTLQNASQHLRVMRDRGTVTTRRLGQQVQYTVVDNTFLDAVRIMRDALSSVGRHEAVGLLGESL